jgi:DnaJ like chaperone protein
MSNDAIETVLRGQRDGWLRRRVRWLARRLGVSRFVRARNPAGSPAFTTALVALAAKMAAADGVAVKSEAEAFERFLEVGPADRARLRRVYDLAKTDTAGFEVYASRINKLLMSEPETKRQVFDCLMYIACADGVVHPAEDAFLREVSTIFGYSEARFRRIRAMFVHDPESERCRNPRSLYEARAAQSPRPPDGQWRARRRHQSCNPKTCGDQRGV